MPRWLLGLARVAWISIQVYLIGWNWLQDISLVVGSVELVASLMGVLRPLKARPHI